MRYIPKPGATAQELSQGLVLTKSGGYTTISIQVSGESAAVNRTVAHQLGRVPSSWSVSRAQPASGVTGNVYEASGLPWTATQVSFSLPGNGSWSISLS